MNLSLVIVTKPTGLRQQKIQPTAPVLLPKEVDDMTHQAAGGDQTELAIHRLVQFGKYRAKLSSGYWKMQWAG